MSQARPTTFRTPPLLAAVLTATVLYFAREVLIPVALAILLTFVLAPLVRRVERLRLPRIAAVMVVMVTTTIGLGTLGWFVEGQVVELALHLPQYKQNIKNKLEQYRRDGKTDLERAGETITQLSKEVTAPAEDAAAVAPSQPLTVKVVEDPDPPLSYARTTLGPLLSPLATAAIVLAFTVFMLIKREDLRSRLIRLVGQRQMAQTIPALDDAALRVSRYVLIQATVNGIAGVGIGLGLFLLGVPGAVLWGLLTAILRFIPYIGTWIAAVLPVALSFAVSDGWTQPILALGVIVVVEAACANILEPLLFCQGTGLSPLSVLAAAVFWGWLWGPVGLMLAVPLTVCLVVIGRHVPRFEFLSVLLGDEPVLPPEAQLYQRLLAGDAEESGRLVECAAKDKTAAEVFDGLLAPALRLGEQDEQRGALDPELRRTVLDTMDAVIADLEPSVPPAAPAPGGAVLIVPAQDRFDEIAGELFQRVLAESGVEAEALSSHTLSGELQARIEAEPPAAVCISVIPPGATLHTRALCKRLKARFPRVPVVVALWDPEHEPAARERLAAAGADSVVVTAKQGADQLRSIVHLERAPALRGA